MAVSEYATYNSIDYLKQQKEILIKIANEEIISVDRSIKMLEYKQKSIL